MFYLYLLIWACISPIHAQQYYDSSDCASDAASPGSRYTCNSAHDSCNTYLIYRAKGYFQTLSNISGLFDVNPDKSTEVLHLNNLTSPSEILNPGREVLIPVLCSCSGQFYQANLSFLVPGNMTFTDIACGVFEGLVKSLTLAQENQNSLRIGSKLNLPLKCACPGTKGFKYLLTYPFIEGDSPSLLAKKFGISLEDLFTANKLDSKPTVYPKTTILVPLKSYPFLNLNIHDSPSPDPVFLPTTTIQRAKKSNLRNLYIGGSVIGFCLVLVTVLSCFLYVKALKKWKVERLQQQQSFNRSNTPLSCASPFTPRSSSNSCLSPDLLMGIKYSLISYTTEELRKATKDFSEKTKIGDGQDYKARINNVDVLIKQMRFEDTRHVIDVHSRINHKNIVSLHGVCYGESDDSWSYLVFEYPTNGCLRDCLTNPMNTLKWSDRTQIALDIATGIHYLHYCIFPTYAHLNISIRQIYLTSNWRAKLANVGTNCPFGDDEKEDIFAFGVVLLEIMSGREDIEGEEETVKECIGFLGGGEGGCFEQLKSFMDPKLKGEYPLAEALCLAVLAKACVEDDPMHRPSMDDILKVLARYGVNSR